MHDLLNYHQKSTKLVPAISSFFAASILYVFSILIIFSFLNLSNITTFENKIQYSEFYVDISNIILSLIFCIKSKQFSNLILFPISMFFLLLMDITYFHVFFVEGKNGSNLVIIINILWYITTISLLLSLLLKYAYGKTERIILATSFAISASVIILFFAQNYIKYLSFPYYSIDFTAHFFIFYLCILLIISSKDKSILFLISSLCVSEIGQIAMIECYFLKFPHLLVYGEFFWCVGLIGISIGFLHLIYSNSFTPGNWFLTSNSIRNKLSFTIFSVSFFGFVLACVAMKNLGTVTNASDAYIPAIALLYSLASAIISVIAGKYIEKPFINFKKYISSMFANKKFLLDSENKYVEFKELQDFLINSYEFKNNMQEEVVSLAKRIAHDIKSPTIVLENIIKTWDSQSNEIIKTQIKKQIDKIAYISRKMLKESTEFEDRTYGVQCIYNIIVDLISDKRIEWGNNCCIDIDFYYNTNNVIWISEKQSEIRVALSNILNNSFEASISTGKNIALSVNLNDENIIITITDNGHGIPSNEIPYILQGKSLKQGGHGIGLSSAKRFVESINGTIQIDSTVGKETNVQIVIPALEFGSNFAKNITISKKNIVILDDDPHIISKWQKFFLSTEIIFSVNYFVSTDQLCNYLQMHNDEEVTYLFDYRLFNEKITGVNIANQFKLKDVYLITNYADDGKLQSEICDMTIKLIPKIMLDTNIITVNVQKD